jgi:hypothetical protein
MLGYSQRLAILAALLLACWTSCTKRVLVPVPTIIQPLKSPPPPIAKVKPWVIDGGVCYQDREHLEFVLSVVELYDYAKKAWRLAGDPVSTDEGK